MMDGDLGKDQKGTSEISALGERTLRGGFRNGAKYLIGAPQPNSFISPFPSKIDTLFFNMLALLSIGLTFGGPSGSVYAACSEASHEGHDHSSHGEHPTKEKMDYAAVGMQ